MLFLGIWGLPHSSPAAPALWVPSLLHVQPPWEVPLMAGLANTIPSSYPMPGVLCRELTLTWGPQHCAYGNQPPGVSNSTTQLTAGDMLLG